MVMAHRATITIDGGCPAYWVRLKRAYALIRRADRAADAVDNAPLYIAGGYNPDGEIKPLENLAPFDHLDACLGAVTTDPAAMRILAAQGRQVVPYDRIRPVMQVAS